MRKVGIVMGSDSDLPVIKKATDMLKTLEIPFEVHIYSAHRTPDESVVRTVEDACPYNNVYHSRFVPASNFVSVRVLMCGSGKRLPYGTCICYFSFLHQNFFI